MSHKFTDKVGATLKRHVMLKVTKRCVTNNAGECCYNAVKDSNIQVTMINTCKLKKYSAQQLKTVFKNAIPIPGLTDFRFIEFADNGYLTSETS